jgi:DNA-binding transcriptional LysR family regulator
MKPHHLKIFLVVHEYRNMTHAARALYLSQPAVSQVISELEEYYHVRLFERMNRRLFPTPAGDQLAVRAREILMLLDQTQQELSDLSQGSSLRIGVSLTIGTHILPELLSNFRQRMPGVEVFSLVDNTHAVEQLLLENRIDLGLVEGSAQSPDVVERPIREDQLVIVAAPAHPLSRKKRVTLADLENGRFIIREEGSGTRATFESAMQAAGVTWQIAGVYNNIDAIKQAAQSNVGLAIVPRISIQKELRQGRVRLVKVQGLSLSRKFSFVFHRQKQITQIMQTLMDCYPAE